MSSIIKVDQIQLADGSTPTLADLSISTTGTGKVLQVVQNYITTTSSYSGIANNPVATQLTASITPTSTTSKIMVEIIGAFSSPSQNHNTQVLKRTIGATTENVGVTTNISNRPPNTGAMFGQFADFNSDAEQYMMWPSLVKFLDTPNTTSEITYTLYYGGYTTSTVYLNRGTQDRNTSTYDPRQTSSVTLYEIAG